MIISRPIHAAENGIISFFCMAEYYSIVCMYHLFFIHSSVDRHLGCFYILATISTTDMAGVGGVHVSFFPHSKQELSSPFKDGICAPCSGSLEPYPLEAIPCMYLFELEFSADICPGAGLLDHFRNLHAVFHSGCTNFHSHQWRGRVPLRNPL